MVSRCCFDLKALTTWFGASFLLLSVHSRYWGVCLVTTLYHRKLSSALDMRIHPWLLFTLAFEQQLVFSLDWLCLNACPVNGYSILSSKLKQLVMVLRWWAQWPRRSCYWALSANRVPATRSALHGSFQLLFTTLKGGCYQHACLINLST